MNKRTESARVCHNGASNPRRIAAALVEAIDECRAEGVCEDSDDAVLVILTQLNHVLCHSGCGYIPACNRLGFN